jgi:thiamine biosynthesis lipoprotein
MKPLLGTFVEITVKHSHRNEAYRKIENAFAGIERVQNLMSFHDPKSEVSKLNRYAFRRSVSVSQETYHVLEMAKKLHQKTRGLFDIAVAPELMSWGVLPRLLFPAPRTSFHGRSSDILLLPARRVRFLRELKIDLGGIAKGFAVDRAVEILRAAGVQNGIVNAGGDLRCFGNDEYPVAVRHPKDKKMIVPLSPLKNTAFATSANGYERFRRHGRWICPHVHGTTRKPCLKSFSVSVIADTCLMADALTKVVLAIGSKAADLMREFKTQAIIVKSGSETTMKLKKQAA